MKNFIVFLGLNARSSKRKFEGNVSDATDKMFVTNYLITWICTSLKGLVNRVLYFQNFKGQNICYIYPFLGAVSLTHFVVPL